MVHELVSKQLIHLLQRFATRLGIEEVIAQHGAHVEDEERVKVAEAHLCQSGRRNLREHQVQQPVAGCGQRVASGASLRAEDLGWIPVGRVLASYLFARQDE